MNEQNSAYTPKQLAERWSLNVGTLANMRCAGTGPRYFKIGKTVRYPLQRVLEFENDNEML